MTVEEGKEKFVEAWGNLGANWGVNKTMAQMHALLLVSTKPLCAEEIMTTLSISRGNSNINIRALQDWGLIYKQSIPGERKDFFVAEKDVWQMIKQIVTVRKSKELEPMIKLLEEISSVQGLCQESVEFCNVVGNLRIFSSKADATLDMLVKSDSNWITGSFMRLIK